MRDLFGIAGLLLLAAGSWWLSPPWSLVVVGAVLLSLAVVAQLWPKKRSDAE